MITFSEVERKRPMFDALTCLAYAIYFEARGEPPVGRIAVAQTVLQRVYDHRFPNNVCDVVYEGIEKGRHKCQFSWYCDGKSDTPKNKTAWEKSRKYARDIYIYGRYIGITEGATHYHANYVKPYWAPTLDRITRIGSHIFYRLK